MIIRSELCKKYHIRLTINRGGRNRYIDDVVHSQTMDDAIMKAQLRNMNRMKAGERFAGSIAQRID